MPVNVLSNPIDLFLDSNGAPLQGGSIYIGNPNTDPTNAANQIAVYQDQALTIHLAQPIKTANGQPWLNGSQIPVYLGAGVATYSLAVMNAGGVIVMSLPSVAPFSLGGSASGSMVTKEFVSGIDFTGGTTTQLTLSANFGSGANVFVDFDGTPQHYPDDFTLSGTTLTFTSPIPANIQKVYTKGGITAAVGVLGNGTVGAAQLAPGAVTAAAIQQAGTGQYWVQNGAQVNRMNDRIAMGGATVGDFTYPPVVLDWFQTHENSVGYTNYSEPAVLNVLTSPAAAAQESAAALFAAQSLTSTSQYASCIGLEAYAVNNNATLATNAWAIYAEAHKLSSTVASVYCMELDTYNLAANIVPNPLQQGSSVGIQLGSGAGINGVTMTASISGTTLTVSAANPVYPTSKIAVGNFIYGVGVPANTQVTGLGTGTGGTGTYTLNNSASVSSEYMVATPQYDSSAAIQIVNNPTRWAVGINFTATALAGCDGVSGSAPAITMARGHSLQWYSPSGNVAANITSTVSNSSNITGIDFTDSGLQITGPGAGAPTLAYFSNTQNAANYLSLIAGQTGQAVNLSANGSDANINLALNPKGSGALQFGTYSAAGGLTPTGYISIVDSGGTARRLLVG